jgi:hypothetical protein
MAFKNTGAEQNGCVLVGAGRADATIHFLETT